MSRKSIACLSVTILAAFIISGCGTSQKKVRSEVTGIKARVETLETRVESVESKQAEAERATAEQMLAMEDMKTAGAYQEGTNISVKVREGKHSARTRDIQQALKNAGYYQGKIDGIKGKGTKKAIKEFQSVSGLKADGVVGPKTWELLSAHLSATSAAMAAGSGDEGVK